MMAEQLRRIALVSTQKRWHGGEAQLALLAEGISQRGYECLLIARRGGKFAERMRQDGYRVAEVSRCGRTPWSLWQLRRIIKRFAPQVVHANDAHALTGSGTASLGLRTPVRVASRRVDFKVKYPGRYRVYADGVLCVSRAVRDVCMTSGLDEHKLHVVHDGVCPNFGASGDRDRGRQRLQLSPQDMMWLTVAKLTDHKGHIYLLRAIAELVPRYPHFVFAFAGEGELRGQLQDVAAELGVQSRVRLLGYRRDVPDLLAASDAVVQPSHMEGLCSSLIDAMFSGTPIVATEAGGIPDLLRSNVVDEPLAWLVPPKDPARLAAAMLELYENPQTASVQAERARSRALAEFTADAMVERTVQIYRELFADKMDQAARRLGSKAA